MVKVRVRVRVLKSVYGSQLAQPHCHLGFAHAIVYGQAITSITLLILLII